MQSITKVSIKRLLRPVLMLATVDETSQKLR
jgi:hypothetical protein